MSLVRSFLRLKISEKIIVAKAVLLTIYYRVIIVFVPFSNLERKSSLTNPNTNDTITDRIVYLTRVSASFVPFSNTCLVRALVAQRLLLGANQSSDIKIGVKKEPDLDIHAWLVDANGRELDISPEAKNYTDFS